jgi:hypothetical protein
MMSRFKFWTTATPQEIKKLHTLTNGKIICACHHVKDLESEESRAFRTMAECEEWARVTASEYTYDDTHGYRRISGPRAIAASEPRATR